MGENQQKIMKKKKSLETTVWEMGKTSVLDWGTQVMGYHDMSIFGLVEIIYNIPPELNKCKL